MTMTLAHTGSASEPKRALCRAGKVHVHKALSFSQYTWSTGSSDGGLDHQAQ